MEGNHTELMADSTSKSGSHVHVAASVARGDIGRVNVQTKESKCPGTVKVKTPFFVYHYDQKCYSQPKKSELFAVIGGQHRRPVE